MLCGCDVPLLIGGKRKKNKRGNHTRKMRGGYEYFDRIKGFVGNVSSWVNDKMEHQTQDLSQPSILQNAGRSIKNGGSCVYSNENEQYKKTKKSLVSFRKFEKSRKSRKSRK
jgi:hypothetical protein